MIGERSLRQILTSWDRLQQPAARDDRVRALSPRPHLRARRAGWRRACASDFADGAQRARRHAWSAATASRSGVRRAGRAGRAARSTPGYYIWRGAPNEADLAPETRAEHLSLLHVLPAASASRSSAIPSPGLNNDARGPASAAITSIWYRVGDARRARTKMCVDENGPPARVLRAAAAHPQGP